MAKLPGKTYSQRKFRHCHQHNKYLDHGVYWLAYDVGTNISTGPVKVEAKTEGDIDGRVYGIVLTAVYEDKEGTNTKYWIEEGNLNLHGKGWSGDMPSTHDS